MFRKYDSIVRYGKKGTHESVAEGQEIVIQEKLDGANASFTYKDGELKAYSRKTELNSKDTLRGFYNWVMENIKPELMVEGATYYGEWLVSHRVTYNDDAYKKFYLFDVVTKYEEFLPVQVVLATAGILGIDHVPVFYAGAFQSIEHIESFVGKSLLGKEGEGVVVKNLDRRNELGQPYIKFVSERFSELQQSPAKKDPTGVDAVLDTMINVPRVAKMIDKLVDLDVIPEDFDLSDMGKILKGLGSSIYEDIMEEEADVLYKQIKIKVGKQVPNVVKQIIAERQSEEETVC